jgi:hypothetical protein
MESPTTRQAIQSAYKSLCVATANALDATRAVTLAQALLEEAKGSRIWPGNNETERKSNLLSGTLAERQALLVA